MLRNVYSVVRFKPGAFQHIASMQGRDWQALTVYGIVSLIVAAAGVDFDSISPADLKAMANDGPSHLRPAFSFLAQFEPSAASSLLLGGSFVLMFIWLALKVLMLKLLFWISGRETPSIRTWYCVMAFASVPQLFDVIPNVGEYIATIYGFALTSIAIRDLTGIGLAKAAAYCLGIVLFPAIVTMTLSFLYLVAMLRGLVPMGQGARSPE